MTVPDKADFIKVLENLAPCLSTNKAKMLYTGYNLNSNKYGIIAMSGFHALSYFNSWCECGRKFDITIPGFTYKLLKKISNVKSSENGLEIYYENDGKYMFFVGCDYVLATRVIMGDFFNFAHTAETGGGYQHSFSTDSGEFYSVAKEYAGISKADTYIHCIELNGKIATTMRTADFRTADCLDITSGNLPEGFHILLDSKYLADVLKTFDGIDITIECGTALTPWKIYNDKYLGLVVPLRMGDNEKEDAETYVKDAFVR